MRISDWSSDVCSSDLRQQNAEADQRPGRAPPPGLQLQQEQTAQTEHQTGDREHVDETAPDRAGVAAFVQIIEPGDPTTIGVLVFDADRKSTRLNSSH